jgi:hypothetical protein
MTTNTITNVETLSTKQNNNTSKLNNNSTSNTSLNFSKNIAQGKISFFILLSYLAVLKVASSPFLTRTIF